MRDLGNTEKEQDAKSICERQFPVSTVAFIKKCHLNFIFVFLKLRIPLSITAVIFEADGAGFAGIPTRRVQGEHFQWHLPL